MFLSDVVSHIERSSTVNMDQALILGIFNFYFIFLFITCISHILSDANSEVGP